MWESVAAAVPSTRGPWRVAWLSRCPCGAAMVPGSALRPSHHRTPTLVPASRVFRPPACALERTARTLSNMNWGERQAGGMSAPIWPHLQTLAQISIHRPWQFGPTTLDRRRPVRPSFSRVIFPKINGNSLEPNSRFKTGIFEPLHKCGSRGRSPSHCGAGLQTCTPSSASCPMPTPIPRAVDSPA